ncbi:MAG: hypothetical protein HN742_41390 [Lentisphaerae bacterium]|jgi:hypothetical protein|nr:hypothetical protein [Lentisphaerota bacterium]MBT4817473.1 hypothetical protein [Lentisphaerota bacterium]MBT5612744.1 hypothetical protein [Lentisphaerota bacterium]MBT7058973.1 hypothetical protein [Lentisphaerota bacterium]MBT7848393.1 hypothetical protein [Lentisphaerota bacterium]
MSTTATAFSFPRPLLPLACAPLMLCGMCRVHAQNAGENDATPAALEENFAAGVEKTEEDFAAFIERLEQAFGKELEKVETNFGKAIEALEEDPKDKRAMDTIKMARTRLARLAAEVTKLEKTARFKPGSTRRTGVPRDK